MRIAAPWAGFRPTSIDDLAIAVSEAVTNAVTHGSPRGRDNRVRVYVQWRWAHIVVSVSDEGPGFDPAQLRPADPSELAAHGYGVHLMRALVDRVEVGFADGTTLRLLKTETDPVGEDVQTQGGAPSSEGRSGAGLVANSIPGQQGG